MPDDDSQDRHPAFFFLSTRSSSQLRFIRSQLNDIYGSIQLCAAAKRRFATDASSEVELFRSSEPLASAKCGKRVSELPCLKLKLGNRKKETRANTEEQAPLHFLSFSHWLLFI
jgi:hypothetical protein